MKEATAIPGVEIWSIYKLNEMAEKSSIQAELRRNQKQLPKQPVKSLPDDYTDTSTLGKQKITVYNLLKRQGFL